jgi:hypothetical protein
MLTNVSSAMFVLPLPPCFLRLVIHFEVGLLHQGRSEVEVLSGSESDHASESISCYQSIIPWSNIVVFAMQ